MNAMSEDARIVRRTQRPAPLLSTFAAWCRPAAELMCSILQKPNCPMRRRCQYPRASQPGSASTLKRLTCSASAVHNTTVVCLQSKYKSSQMLIVSSAVLYAPSCRLQRWSSCRIIRETLMPSYAHPGLVLTTLSRLSQLYFDCA